jgi:hypothetical protein
MAVLSERERLSRRRARRKFGLEVVAVLGVTAAAVGAVYLLTAEKVASPWTAAGTNVQNVSRARGIQSEVSIAIDQKNPRTLFAASNETSEIELRVYTSTDGGRTWTSRRGPLFNRDTCVWGDPSVGVGPDGRQYVAFTEKSVCTNGPDLQPYLVVGSRSGAHGKWVVRRLARPAVKFGFDDRPSLAVTSDGHVHVVWSRLLGRRYQTTVISSSSDGGRTWSSPRPIDDKLRQPQLISLTAGPGNTLYIAGVDASMGIWVGRSADGGRSFAITRGARLPGNRAATCIVFGGYLLPQQSLRCLGPNPVVSVGRDRVFVTYGVNAADGYQKVRVAAFDPSLRRLSDGPIGPVDSKKTDQFWPVSTVDPKTGRLWACYYDSTGDQERKRAWFACTISADGRHWARPVRATPTSANAGVLWQDAAISGYGDSGGWGGYPGLAAHAGTAYPLWIDTSNPDANEEEIFGSRLSAAAFKSGK